MSDDTLHLGSIQTMNDKYGELMREILQDNGINDGLGVILEIVKSFIPPTEGLDVIYHKIGLAYSNHSYTDLFALLKKISLLHTDDIKYIILKPSFLYGGSLFHDVFIEYIEYYSYNFLNQNENILKLFELLINLIDIVDRVESNDVRNKCLDRVTNWGDEYYGGRLTFRTSIERFLLQSHVNCIRNFKSFSYMINEFYEVE